MTEAVQVALIVATPPTIAACGAVFLGILNRQKLEAVHLEFNSRFTEFLQLKGESSFAAGMKAQKDKQDKTGI